MTAPSPGDDRVDEPRRIVAVVVTYRPDLPATAALLAALRPQVDLTLVIDNGSAPQDVDALRALLAGSDDDVVALGSNLGIAAAQNLGIARARERGATHVLLSDQDSRPASDMVDRLVTDLVGSPVSAAGRPVGAVGPVIVDERNPGAILVFAARRWGPRRADLPAADGARIDAVFLLASGCLIDARVLDDVGPMNEGWFIDHIDLEWGLRARRAGYDLFAVVGAHLEHSLGDRTQRIPGRERDVHVHSPVRNYYMVRNTLLLVRSGLLPVAWRWGYAAWITKYSGFYVLAVAPRVRRARLITRAVVDAARRRTGPVPTTTEDATAASLPASAGADS